MATVRHHIRIAAPADSVWKTVSDAASIADWFGPIAKSAATATGRTIELADGTVVDEDTVTNDHELRRFQYTIKRGLPVDQHLGTFDVFEDGSGSFVVYSADLSPDELGPTFHAVMAEGIKGLKEFCERQA